MIDRELLKLAAKAAELPVEWDGDGFVIATKFRGCLTNYDPWDPLTDDGDALRLVVKLRINLIVKTLPHAVVVEAYTGLAQSGMETLEDVRKQTRDPNAATRRAIVRAAAEIGRGM